MEWKTFTITQVTILFFVCVYIFSGCNTTRLAYYPCPKKIYDDPLAAIEAYLKDAESEDGDFFADDPRTLFRLYADSINQYEITGVFPKIFLHFCFDYENPEYWAGTYKPLCLRVGILSYVTNAKSLSLLMKEHKDILEYVCNRPGNCTKSSVPMPNCAVSWHILMKIRLKKLKKAKKR